MDEDETGVGEDGFRLGMFAYTSPHRAKAVRLVVEHGNLSHQQDTAIINRPDFTERCAAAAVDAFTEVFGEPLPQPGPINWQVGDVGIGVLNGAKVLRMVEEVTAVRDTQPRCGASTRSKRFGPKIREGETRRVVGTLNSNWVFVDNGDGLFPRASRSAFRPLLRRPKDVEA